MINVLLLEYVLSNKIKEQLEATTGISSVVVEKTVLPRDGDFFGNIDDVDDPEEYLKWITSCLKLTVTLDDNSKERVYFYFRNKRAEVGSFTEPSSFEFGNVEDGQFNSWHKTHYSDFDEMDCELDDAQSEMMDAIATDCIVNLKANLIGE